MGILLQNGYFAAKWVFWGISKMDVLFRRFSTKNGSNKKFGRPTKKIFFSKNRKCCFIFIFFYKKIIRPKFGEIEHFLGQNLSDHHHSSSSSFIIIHQLSPLVSRCDRSPGLKLRMCGSAAKCGWELLSVGGSAARWVGVLPDGWECCQMGILLKNGCFCCKMGVFSHSPQVH